MSELCVICLLMSIITLEYITDNHLYNTKHVFFIPCYVSTMTVYNLEGQQNRHDLKKKSVAYTLQN